MWILYLSLPGGERFMCLVLCWAIRFRPGFSPEGVRGTDFIKFD
ncbi:hypothetical protein HMPREF3039_01091 [Akkermansia sp. KLE1798]|nr:hypothetical protein HMPREF3039_01091 [Akkermansia sp. KLE1798]KZA05965.1 hypothetical protein HMPREF1326_00227 [Akkermansia sp. KLE1605]